MNLFFDEIKEIEDLLRETSKAIVAYRDKLTDTLSVDDDIVEDVFGEGIADHYLEIGRLRGELDAMRRTTSELWSRLHNLRNQSLRKTTRFENYIRGTLG